MIREIGQRIRDHVYYSGNGKMITPVTRPLPQIWQFISFFFCSRGGPPQYFFLFFKYLLSFIHINLYCACILVIYVINLFLFWPWANSLPLAILLVDMVLLCINDSPSFLCVPREILLWARVWSPFSSCSPSCHSFSILQMVWFWRFGGVGRDGRRLSEWFTPCWAPPGGTAHLLLWCMGSLRLGPWHHPPAAATCWWLIIWTGLRWLSDSFNERSLAPALHRWLAVVLFAIYFTETACGWVFPTVFLTWLSLMMLYEWWYSGTLLLLLLY